MKIAHIADLHISAPTREQSIEAFRAAAEEAIEHQCDLFIIAGDMWDRSITLGDAGPVMPAVRIVRDIAACMPVVIVKGNHDGPGTLEIFEELHTMYEVVVAGLPRQERVMVNLDTLESVTVSCLPYPTKSFLLAQTVGSQDDTDAQISAALRSIIMGFAAGAAETPNDPHVLVFHGNVTGSATETGQIMLGGDVMVSAADLEMSCADYVALGHIHKRQQLGTRCFYPGSTFHVTFGETEPRYMNIVTLERGAEPHVEAVRLPSRPKVVIEVLSDGTTAEPLDLAAIAGADVKVRVRMTEEEAATFDEDAVTAPIAAAAHSVRVERIITPKERIRAEHVAEAPTLEAKLGVYGEAVGVEITEGMREKARVLEGGVA